MEIIEVQDLSREYFLDAFVKPSVPVLIKGGASYWGATSKWSPDYLISSFGDKEVELFESSEAFFNYTNINGVISKRSTSFGDAVALIESGNGIDKFYYLAQKSLRDDFYELATDYELPSLISDVTLHSSNFWYGSLGNITQLHYDRSNNFLVQVRGRKRIVLFPPSDYEFLYLNLDSHLPHFSLLNTRSVDLNKYPQYDKATPTVVSIGPGEILYIPPFWFHEVETVDTGISVNFWWAAHVLQVLVPAVLNNIISIHSAGELTKILSAIDTSGFEDNFELAEHLNANGFPWLAILVLDDISKTLSLNSDIYSEISDLVALVSNGNREDLNKDLIGKIINVAKSEVNISRNE